MKNVVLASSLVVLLGVVSCDNSSDPGRYYSANHRNGGSSEW
jgi:hypothetical protein